MVFNRAPLNEFITNCLDAIEQRRTIGPAQSVILVSIPRQELLLIRKGRLTGQYPVSTARNGPGSEVDSEKTPLGLHQIAEKIGDGEPAGTVFRGRRTTGETIGTLDAQTLADHDLITSRILWLSGLEPGINQGPGVDSKARYIYIHGTQCENDIGRPVSHGCIRMTNHDVIALFDSTAVGDLVYVSSE